MFTRITLLLLSLLAITSPCFAGDVTFGEAKTAVSGADAKELKVEDLDGDSKPDLIWRDSSGNLKYSLQTGSVAIPTEGLVAYYPFNGNANDESVNVNNGTVNGASLTADRYGTSNKAYSFDGVNDYIYSPQIQVFFSDESVTLSVWFNANKSGLVVTEIESAVGCHGGWCENLMAVSDSGMVYIKAVDMQKVDLGIITFGTWHHAILRYSKSGLKLDGYLDGRLSASYTTGDRKVPFEFSAPLYYGFGYGVPNNVNFGDYFKGLIGDIRIYNRALSELEIQALYNEGP
ncbi:LamG domain-containing protein [Deltaproteobacteria bacterium TL4]